METRRTVLKPGNGADRPNKGDMITADYTGYLYDEENTSEHFKGKIIDSTEDREPFTVVVGLGKVIKGWDRCIMEMTVGERSIITIRSDDAYGERGFYNLIPPDCPLVFDLTLTAIERKGAGNPQEPVNSTIEEDVLEMRCSSREISL